MAVGRTQALVHLAVVPKTRATRKRQREPRSQNSPIHVLTAANQPGSCEIDLRRWNARPPQQRRAREGAGAPGPGLTGYGRCGVKCEGGWGAGVQLWWCWDARPVGGHSVCECSSPASQRWGAGPCLKDHPMGAWAPPRAPTGCLGLALTLHPLDLPAPWPGCFTPAASQGTIQGESGDVAAPGRRLFTLVGGLLGVTHVRTARVGRAGPLAPTSAPGRLHGSTLSCGRPPRAARPH